MTPTRVTVELGTLIESGFQLWNFDYPSYYKGEEKTAFEQKVIEHYYFRQIGQETPQRFRHYFQARIREIMPYYLQLYKSQEIMDAIEDPFGNVDVTETVRQTTTGERSGESESENSNSMSAENSSTKTGTENETLSRETNGSARKLDTPQGSVGNLDSYLTEGEKRDETESTERGNNVSEQGSETASSSASGEGSESHSESHSETLEYTSTKKGNQGVNTYAHDMRELRETFLNIDKQIIEELADLFLLVY